MALHRLSACSASCCSGSSQEVAAHHTAAAKQDFDSDDKTVYHEIAQKRPRPGERRGRDRREEPSELYS